MPPRAKGKASKTKAPPLSVAADGVPVLHTDAIIVEDPPSAPPSEASPSSTQPNNKQKKKVPASEKKTKADTPKKKECNRGKVALKMYWEEVSSLAPQGTDVDAWKDALSGVRKIAIAQLKQKGALTIPGLCSLRVYDVKGRDAGQTRLFGQMVDVKARPPYKKVVAKCARSLIDSVVKEINK